MKKMRFCVSCGKYTLKGMHCRIISASAHPQKFNQNDRYAFYRRMSKGLVQIRDHT